MSRFRWMLLNAALAAVVIGAVPGLVAVGASVGTAMKLGVNNTVNAITKLTATTSASQWWKRHPRPIIGRTPFERRPRCR